MYPYLSELGVDVNILTTETPSNLPRIAENRLTNGMVLDLVNLSRNMKTELGVSLVSWIARLCGADVCSLNKAALLSKIHRVQKSLKGKRGQGKLDFLHLVITLPTHTASSAPKTETKIISQELHAKEEELERTKLQLQERRETVQTLHEKHKQLKRKYERLGVKEENVTVKRKKEERKTAELNKEIKGEKQKVKNLEARLKNAKITGDKYFRLSMERNREIKRLRQKIISNEADRSTKSPSKEKAEVIQLRKKVKDNNVSISFLQELLEDSTELQLWDKESRCYTPQTVNCVMNLTNLKVASEKVGRVIKEVSGLCGKTPNAVPSTSTVNRIVDAKVAVAQQQISEVLATEKHTTLYSDETRKYGRTMETYVITDQSQTSYILGLRDMANKSSATTLDTFKDILDDINDHCHVEEKQNRMHKGYEILANIRDTMSDRASTQKAFNTLLENFRASILPQIVDGWQDLDEKEKALCSKMNNFFCGLHLLVGMADTCEEVLKKFEKSFLEGKLIGSAKHPELKCYHKSESGVLRLIRTCCKCFAVGEDEKSGCSLEWKTYLQSHLSDRNQIVRFKHNRFNLVFALGHAIYYHHVEIPTFLDTVHGTSNNLLRAVSHDIKEDLYLAGAKALGLISKFVTGPLWRLLEGKEHILDMNNHYKTLVDFLDNGSNDTEVISNFMTGQTTPWDTPVDDRDNVLMCLVAEKPAVDKIVCPLLQNLFKAMHGILARMVTDHLPGGKFWNPGRETVMQTRSTMAHNKLPEFVFGQLDQLLRYRPNATLLTNESFLMYTHNRTREWLDGLDEKKRNKLLTDCRKEGAEIRKQFKNRLKEIERQRVEQQRKRQRDLEEKERKRVKIGETLTNDVCFYGLWQSEEQLKECVHRLPLNEQRKAIEAQLKFRKTVLKQKHENPKLFSFSKKNEAGKYVKHSTEDLQENLLTLIRDTLTSTTAEQHQEGVPLFVGKYVEHTFTDGVYDGFVISIVPGFPKWYNVRYKDDSAIYAYNLCQDYESGDLKIVLRPSWSQEEQEEEESVAGD